MLPPDSGVLPSDPPGPIVALKHGRRKIPLIDSLSAHFEATTTILANCFSTVFNVHQQFSLLAATLGAGYDNFMICNADFTFYDHAFSFLLKRCPPVKKVNPMILLKPVVDW